VIPGLERAEEVQHWAQGIVGVIAITPLTGELRIR